MSLEITVPRCGQGVRERTARPLDQAEPMAGFGRPAAMPALSITLPVGRRSVTAAALVLVLAGCSSGAASPTPASSETPSTPSVTPSSTPVPTVAGIEHRTGATDVVLRLEEGGGFVPIDFLASQA